jgi:hypothetical protein
MVTSRSISVITDKYRSILDPSSLHFDNTRVYIRHININCVTGLSQLEEEYFYSIGLLALNETGWPSLLYFVNVKLHPYSSQAHP